MQSARNARRSKLRLRCCLFALTTASLVGPLPAAAAGAHGVIAWGCAGIGFNGCAVPAAASSGVTAVAAGAYYSLALKNDGGVVAFGCGGPGTDYGQCTVPAAATSGVKAIAAGWVYALALKNDGVLAWGCAMPGGGTATGACQVPAAATSGVTAISAGSGNVALALKQDGSVVAWGCNGLVGFGCDVPPAAGSGVTAIAAGAFHSLALKDGGVLAWGCGGSNDSGQCTVPAAATSGVKAIAASTWHSLALRQDGSVVAWGCGGGNDSGQCTVPATAASGVIAIAAGQFHSLALKQDGSVVAWGCGGITNAGQCTVPGSASSRATAIAAGWFQSLALFPDPVEQAIAVGMHAPAVATYKQTFVVAASSSSGRPVAISSSGACTNSGATVTLTSGTGTCVVKYDQAGDDVYNPAPQVVESVTAQKADQTISFGALANRAYGARDFTVSATSSSGLTVSFTASGNCTVSGTTVHLTGAGSCTVTASQPGDSNYNAAGDVVQRFAIARTPCTVPRVVGKRLAAAKLAITRSHCRTGKVRYATSRKKKGVVTSQNRRPGRVLPPGAKVAVAVSSGAKR